MGWQVGVLTRQHGSAIVSLRYCPSTPIPKIEIRHSYHLLHRRAVHAAQGPLTSTLIAHARTPADGLSISALTPSSAFRYGAASQLLSHYVKEAPEAAGVLRIDNSLRGLVGWMWLVGWLDPSPTMGAHRIATRGRGWDGTDRESYLRSAGPWETEAQRCVHWTGMRCSATWDQDVCRRGRTSQSTRPERSVDGTGGNFRIGPRRNMGG